MTKTLVILQSNYLPWKGYFDLMAAADEFVLFDEVQFTKNDWRNRNKIVLGGKLHWLTIPVATAGKLGTPISSIEPIGTAWAKAHWETMTQAYSSASHFKVLWPTLEDTYAEAASLTRLSAINRLFLMRLGELLGIATPFIDSASIPRTVQDPTARLVEICRARGATRYISGPAARAYLRKDQLDSAGIELFFANYQNYPYYDQAMAPFEHGVSIIDTLMRCGLEARSHLKSLRAPESFLDPA